MLHPCLAKTLILRFCTTLIGFSVNEEEMVTYKLSTYIQKLKLVGGDEFDYIYICAQL